MSGPSVTRRSVLAGVTGAVHPLVAGCSGNSRSESDFSVVDQRVVDKSSSDCTQALVELTNVGDGELGKPVEMEMRLLGDSGTAISDWHRSEADFSRPEPVRITQNWCDAQEEGDIGDAAAVEWRFRQ